MLEWFDEQRGETSIVETHHGETKQFTRIIADLNRGARGAYVYLSYSRQAPSGWHPITAVHATVCGEVPPAISPGWEYVTWRGTPIPADTNKGARGPYIFISVKRE
jgi:hypothetical protein